MATLPRSVMKDGCGLGILLLASSDRDRIRQVMRFLQEDRSRMPATSPPSRIAPRIEEAFSRLRGSPQYRPASDCVQSMLVQVSFPHLGSEHSQTGYDITHLLDARLGLLSAVRGRCRTKSWEIASKDQDKPDAPAEIHG